MVLSISTLFLAVLRESHSRMTVGKDRANGVVTEW
uniref:Uncharacterized protein n=1 Tax=Siphoviridae sp. ctxdc10 TaxID=2825740 RepID=A0A8S5TSK7_9CAUD|nr:MAG TPA: hypothetical protein [Siphoviridae sp. ctxdc10]